MKIFNMRMERIFLGESRRKPRQEYLLICYIYLVASLQIFKNASLIFVSSPELDTGDCLQSK